VVAAVVVAGNDTYSTATARATSPRVMCPLTPAQYTRVPVTNLPASANYNLCGQTLAMPTTVTGHNDKGSALTSQVFNTPIGKLECAKEKISGTVTTLKTGNQNVAVQYEGCIYFGTLLKATLAEYELNANGTYTSCSKLSR
jgi:hypothetical protein